MSKNIHVTIRNYKRMTKVQPDGQFVNRGYDMNQWNKKRLVNKKKTSAKKIGRDQK
jgi:hypothetical protein